MKRYYSHYTYIYPSTYLKNTVVEMDNTNNIIDVLPFEKELEKTQFYPGILFFIPNSLIINQYVVEATKKRMFEVLGEELKEGLEVNAIMCNIDV